MRKTKLIFALAGLLLATTSCVKEEKITPGPNSDGDVVVHFATGSSTPQTRGAFDVDTPVKLFIYQRNGAMDLTGTPYKTAEGVTGIASGGLSTININTVNGVAITDGKLTVKSGRDYDFVILVNAPNDAAKPELGAINAGVMTGIHHGVDLLAGRTFGSAIAGTPLEVKFTNYGADNAGNLPHLGSNIATEATLSQALIDFLSGTPELSIVRTTFKECLPESASFAFSSNPLAYVVSTSKNSTHAINYNSTPVSITSPTVTALADNGYLLPYISTRTDKKNLMSIDFTLGLNGASTTFSATAVEAPEFKPGYRYKFILELDKTANADGSVDLYIAIVKWDSVDWGSGMGGDAGNYEVIKIGSWSSVRWTTGMGGEDGVYQILSVNGWRSINWASQMGN